ncbi:MAG: hypothetical protein ACIAS6_12275 [Phycisphaerales bacterium JB060]
MGDHDTPPPIAGSLERAHAIEPLFAVERAVLDRIAAATAPRPRSNPMGAIAELVMTLVEASAGGLKPAYRAGVDPTHAATKLTFASGELRLTLMLEPTTPGLPLGMPVSYRVLGRLTGTADVAGRPVVASAKESSQDGTLDEFGFFELGLPSGLHRLEITLPTTLIVVPKLEVGAPKAH